MGTNAASANRQEIRHTFGSMALATNPLWAAALRMLGQFLLRERAGEHTAWDAAFDAFHPAGGVTRLAADLLLGALCLDPLAESLLSERANLLFADHGARLNRLLRRFHHVATLPLPTPAVNTDPSLALYVEATFRSPIVARWPAVIRFLTAHRDRVAELLSPAVTALCHTWLNSTPTALESGSPMPYRKELGEIALASTPVLQVAQGKGTIFLDGSEKPFYLAAFSGAQEIPDEVAAWALEMGQRRPCRQDVAAEIAQYHRQRAQEHAERLRTDPVYREQCETRRSCGIASLPSYRELPPWPFGPAGQVERAFRSLKTIDLKVRPIHHRLEARVRAHIFLCMLAYYVEWHTLEAWRPLLFSDEDQTAKQTRDPVAPAERSEAALRKVHAKVLDDGTVVHSFRTLLKELSGIVRNVCRRRGAGSDEPAFEIVTTPDPKQQRAYDLLETITV